MSIYLERYAWKDSLFPDVKPAADLEMVVVIPCYYELEIEKALLSLNACNQPCNLLVLVVINESDEDESTIRNQNVKSLHTIEKLKSDLRIPTLVTHQKLPPKKAGVGLARKMGMDEAVRFFEKLDKDGIIICFDADCTCQPNYLEEIYKFYQGGKKEAGIVFYEHDLSINTEAITNYEIYLRYYVNALRFAGFPYSLQTMGSCITIRAKRYQKEGGMNTRKAGEDFYFLHKVIPNGKFGEINSTTIYPSARISDRVPFGTGHAINKYINANEKRYLTYNPKIFEEIKRFVSKVDSFYNQRIPILSPCVRQFLYENDFEHVYNKMLRQSTDLNSFKKYFFAWFDGLRVLKFVHFARDNYYVNVELTQAVEWLGEQIPSQINFSSKERILEGLRSLDRHS